MSNNLPELKNTWEFSLNNVAGTNISTLQSYQETIFTVKETLVNLASNPWSVHLSSNSVNYSNDGGTVILPYEDLSGNGNDGTPVGIDPSNITSDTPGGAFSTRSTTYDSSSEYISMGNILNFNPTDPFSVSAWFKKSVGGETYIVSKFTGARGWNIKLSFGFIEFWFADAFASRIEVNSTTGGLDDGSWHHVVCTYDGSTNASGVSIYIDGSSDTTSTVADALGATTTHTDSFNISGYSDGISGEFNGQIDDVAVYDKELTSGEVTTIYNSGAPNDLTSNGPTGNLVGYWAGGDDSVISTPTDTWFTRSNVVWATPPTARAWTVLQHPTKDLQVLFDCDNGTVSGRIASTYISLGGLFAGGDTTTRPTAVDEIEAGDGESWNGLDTSAFDSWVHVWQTDDASKTRVLVTTDNSENRGMFWLFDDIDSFADQWTNQSVAMICQAKSDASVLGNQIFATQNSDFNQLSQINPFPNNSNPISFFGGQLRSAPGAFSKSSVLFNGDGSTAVNEHIDCGNVLAFDNTDPFSISCWFRCTITPSQVRGLVSKLANASPSTGYGLSLNADGQIVWELINDDVTNHARIETVDSFEDGEWHHVVATYDGYDDVSGMSIYVDNIEQDVTVTYNNLTSSIIDTDVLRLGSYGSTLGWVGNIDDIAIFDGYLDAIDVSDIYNSGDPRDERISGLSSILVGYWLMGDTDDGYGADFPTIEDVSGNGYDGTAQNMEGWEFPYGDTPANPIIYFRLASPIADNEVGTSSFLYHRPGSDVHNELDGFPRLPDNSGNEYHATAINMENADIVDPDVPLASIQVPDLSRSNNPGTPNNMEDADFTTDMPSSIVGYSALLDGSNEFIEVGDVDELRFEFDDPFSISAWFKSTSTASTAIVAKEASSGSFSGYMVFHFNGQIVVRLEGDVVNNNKIEFFTVDNSFNDGAWHHVVMTYDGSSTLAGTECYVDNTLQSKTSTVDTASNSLQTTASFQIGRRDTNALFDGTVTDVAVFNKELTSGEVTTIYNSGTPTDLRDEDVSTHLVGYWRMQAVQSANSTGALLFDGSNEYAAGGVVNLDFASSDELSISALVKMDASGGGQIISKSEVNGSGNRGWDFRIGGGTGILSARVQEQSFGAADQLEVTGTAAAVNDARWHHVVMVKPFGLTVADEVRFYVDGEQLMTTINSDTLATDISGNGTPLEIGRFISGTYFDGMLDDIAVYNKELTVDEVRAIFGNERSEFSLNCLNFDGSSKYVDVGDEVSVSFDVGDAFSISVWMRSRGSGSAQSLVSKRDASGDETGYELSLLSTGVLQFQIIDAVGSSQITRVSDAGLQDLADGFWHHVVVAKGTTEDADDIDMYVDGVFVTREIDSDTFTSGGGTSFDNTIGFEIGSLDSGTNPFDGNIDDVGVYDKKLTASEVKTIYNDGMPNDLQTNGPDGYLVAYWLMGDASTAPGVTIPDQVGSADGYGTGMFGSDILGDGATPYRTDGYIDDLTLTAPDGYLVAYWKMGDEGLGSYPCSPIGIFSDYGYNGFYGFLEDMYWSPEILGTSPGDTFPNDPDNRQWVNSGNMMFPYPGDNTVPSFGTTTANSETHDLQLISSSAGGGGRARYYQMEGIDSGNPSQPAYHNWVVTGTPDPAGAQAVGSNAPPFGGPLLNINVSATWID